MNEYKVLIIDGDYMMHRMLRQGNLRKLSYKVHGEEIPTGIIKGVFGTMYNLIKDFKPDTIYFCITGGTCQFRRDIYPGYKVREDDGEFRKVDTENGEKFSSRFMLKSQTEVLREILPTFGIRVMSAPGFEADDCGLYTAFLYNKDPNNYEVTLVSDDWDWAQICQYGSNILRPMADNMHLTPENFKEVVGISKELFIYQKALLGDSSDKIPNAVKGLGAKTSEKLFNGIMTLDWKTISVDKILEVSGEFISPRLSLLLKENKKDFVRNLELMAMTSGVCGKIYPYLKPVMTTPVKFDFNKATIVANKYGMESLSSLLVHPLMNKLS